MSYSPYKEEETVKRVADFSRLPNSVISPTNREKLLAQKICDINTNRLLNSGVYAIKLKRGGV
jgi:hypothetical protein